MDDVNHILILGCGVAHFCLGGLWYSPLLMSKPWLRGMGLNMDDIREGAKPMKQALLVSGITSVLTAYFLGFLVATQSEPTALTGAVLGLSAWVVFGLAAYARAHVWEDRPIRLIAIDSGYEAIGAAGIGAVLGAFG